MRCPVFQREENYNEYLRLLQDDNYTDITYDEASGGVSAVHKRHKFDKQWGCYGMRRGDYERSVLDVMRKAGRRIVLESELATQNRKKCDGALDDVPMEIKAIEGMGTWAISTKLGDADRQHAQCVVLFFPNMELYSAQRVHEGIRLYQSSPNGIIPHGILTIIVIVRDRISAIWNKKATPIEGWSVSEGLRGQNGASPFTIPPSSAKI